MFQKAFWVIALTLLIGSIANASEIRRVVTTLDANDRSTTLADGQVTLSVSGSGNKSTNLWLTNSSPPGFSFPADAAKPTGLDPPDNGTVFRVVDVPPLGAGDEAVGLPRLDCQGAHVLRQGGKDQGVARASVVAGAGNNLIDRGARTFDERACLAS